MNAIEALQHQTGVSKTQGTNNPWKRPSHDHDHDIDNLWAEISGRKSKDVFVKKTRLKWCIFLEKCKTLT